MDNHLQIFSFKSNLIANTRVPGNVGHSKNTNFNPQSRMKSLCFSNMLQNIKNNYGRERFQQKSNYDIQKENNTMVVQAKNFKVAYGHETPLIAQPPKSIMPQSRSFLIRSHHRKTVTSTSQMKAIQQTKQAIQCPIIGLDLPLKQYNFDSVKQLSVDMAIIWKKNHLNSQRHHLNAGRPELSVFISANLIRTQIISLTQTRSLLQNLLNKNISVYIISSTKQKAYKLHSFQQISDYCHIIYPQIQHHQQSSYFHSHSSPHSASNSSNLKNKQIFINLNSINSNELSFNLLFLQPHSNYHTVSSSIIGNKQNSLYFPYYKHQQNINNIVSLQQPHNCVFVSSNFNKNAASFLRISTLNVIKSISVQYFLSHDQIVIHPQQCRTSLSLNTVQQRKIKLQINCGINTRKPQLNKYKYPLKSNVQLYLECRQRNKSKIRILSQDNHHHSTSISMCASRQSSSVHSSTTFNIVVNQLQGLHQKLIQYSKVVKKQLQSSSQIVENNPKTGQQPQSSISNPLGIINIKKQQRKSLNSKSTYQQINELIRNNVNINRQISNFVNESKGICLKNIDVSCDNVSYYVIQ